MTTEQEHPYLAYLLRIWQVSDSDSWRWRVSLERTHPDERIGFSSLEEFCRYLHEQTAALSAAQQKVPPTDS